MGPRIREDNGWGRALVPTRGRGDGLAAARTTEGRAPTRDSPMGEGCGGDGMGLHPRSNLPPSRGKGGRGLFDAAGGDAGSGVHYDGIGKHVVQAAFIDSQTHHEYDDRKQR